MTAGHAPARRDTRGGRRAGRESSGARPAGAVLRSLTASGALVVRRRARRDLALLLALGALVATSTLLSVAGPRLVLATIDAGARDTVSRTGSQGDVALRTVVGDGATLSSSEVRVARTENFVELAATVTGRLPETLRGAVAGTTATAVSPGLTVTAEDGEPASTLDEDGEVRLQVGLLTDDVAAVVELVDGALPEPRTPARASAPVDVVVAEQGADAASLSVGSTLTVALVDPATGGRTPLDVVVVGVVRVPDAGTEDPAGATGGAEPGDLETVRAAMPELAAPTFTAALSDRPAVTRLTVLTPADGFTAASGRLGRGFDGTVAVRVDPDAVTTTSAAQIATEIAGLRSNPAALSEGVNAPVSVATALDEVLAAYPAQARAALAQMSVMIAGVIGVGAVVVVLLSRLLVLRRGGAVALERARGASVAGVGLRLALEALVVTALGVALGVGLAQVLVPGDRLDPGPALAVALVALLASPLQGMWLARAAWTGRREPANRQDRAQAVKRRRARRVVVEAGAVALAGAALLSLRGRGLLQTQTQSIDPFLAVAPLLLAIAVTVLLLRAYPWPVRAAGALGRRGRGVLGLLGAVRAERAVAALPLLALTLGVALAVGGGLLVGTVRSGQVEASWQRVGADVRFESETAADDAAALAEHPGVTAVGVAEVAGSVSLKLGPASEIVTVLAVDEGWVDLVGDLPGGPAAGDPAGDLAVLAAPDDAGAPLPVVLGPSLDGRAPDEGLAMFFGPSLVELDAVGGTEHAPGGWLEGPFAYVGLDAVAGRLDVPVEGDTVLVVGPDADQAVADLGVPPGDVVSRAQWLDARRDLALLAGVEQLMVLAVLAVLALAVVALVATVLSGARERGRALSMLRTLGMHPRLGWWLALAELAPVVLAAVVGGVAAGVAIVVLLAPALGLDVLSGGLGQPAPSISPTVLAGLAGGAVLLLVLAVLAEVLAHRRDRLSEVLRVGETA